MSTGTAPLTPGPMPELPAVIQTLKVPSITVLCFFSTSISDVMAGPSTSMFGATICATAE